MQTFSSRHSIRVIRRTFDELALDASVDQTTSVLRVSSIEISTVYFRAGYTPNDYPSVKQYATRFLLEGSRAIQCPSIPLQLAGGKKVQQVLAEPGVLERFVEVSAQADALRTTWMGMWALEKALDLVRSRYSELVLKPQREGGGNNIYKESIPAFLNGLQESERAAWIAMELIVPPEGVQNYLVRADGDGKTAVLADVVSELGIFGWSLFGNGEVKEEKEAGWLVRTKGKESNEGGVATGFSVLDSVVLVDG
jgi:glutathione synthase